jgi:hypothetical protein
MTGESRGPYGDWTIQLTIGKQTYMLCRIWFEQDGTYSVSAPYHEANASTIFRALALPGGRNAVFEESIRRLSFSNEDDRPRLMHHPDGTLELWSSELPIIDGTNVRLTIHGAPMDDKPGPIPPPSFRCIFHNPAEFTRGGSAEPEGVTFERESIAPRIGADSYQLEGAFFPADWREFLIRDGERWILRIVHGSSGVISLRALLSSPVCEKQGFLGIAIRRVPAEAGGGGFLLKGIGSTWHQDGTGVTDEIICIYPEPLLPALARAETLRET